MKILKTSHLIIAASAALACHTSAQEFGYHGDIGPEAVEWCNLSPSYGACCEGQEQSPINIVTSDARFEKTLSKLKFHFRGGPTSLNVVNNGHSVQANVAEGAGSLVVEGGIFNLLQFHFHTPSEHTVNGQHAPIEMHLVHKTVDGAHTAVVSVLVESGKEAKELQAIWNVLPDEENEQVTVNSFLLHKILPSGNGASYRYVGSLTTPPCSEGVFWIIMADPITMSPEQISQFQAVFSGEEFPQGNARPTQPLLGREIITDAR